MNKPTQDRIQQAADDFSPLPSNSFATPDDAYKAGLKNGAFIAGALYEHPIAKSEGYREGYERGEKERDELKKEVDRLKAGLEVALSLRYDFEDAPVDFLGTGSDSSWADKEEEEWEKSWSDKLKTIESLTTTPHGDSKEEVL